MYVTLSFALRAPITAALFLANVSMYGEYEISVNYPGKDNGYTKRTHGAEESCKSASALSRKIY